MKRRALVALFLFFFLASAATAPIAFRLGFDHAYAAALKGLPGGADPSHLATTRTFRESDCAFLGARSNFGRPGVEVDCLEPRSHGDRALVIAAAPATAQPVRDAKATGAHQKSAKTSKPKIENLGTPEALSDAVATYVSRPAAAPLETTLAGLDQSGAAPDSVWPNDYAAYFGWAGFPVQTGGGLPPTEGGTPPLPTAPPAADPPASGAPPKDPPGGETPPAAPPADPPVDTPPEEPPTEPPGGNPPEEPPFVIPPTPPTPEQPTEVPIPGALLTMPAGIALLMRLSRRRAARC